MAAGVWDFDDAVAGATWSRRITWRRQNADGTAGDPYDLSTALRGIFRLRKGDVVVEGTATLQPNGELGVIDLVLDDEATYALSGRASYTVAVVFTPDDVRPVLNGKFRTNRSALVPTEA